MLKSEAAAAIREALLDAWPDGHFQWVGLTDTMGSLMFSPVPGEADQLIHVDFTRYTEVDALVDDVIGAIK